MSSINFKNAVREFFTHFFLLTALVAASASTASTHVGGDFVNKQYKIKGDWSLVQSDGAWVIRLSDNFKTKSGPDLKIFLSPQTIESVNGRTATEGSVLVSVLESSRGGQEYVLPAGIDPKNFESLLIHCEQFSVLWGGANIS